MSTLYDLLKVEETATQEELEKAYCKILEKAESLPQNEKIVEQVRRVKIAYGILSDVEKRQKYDLDLATQRADELLKNVQVKKTEDDHQITKTSAKQESEKRFKQTISEQIDKMVENNKTEQIRQENEQKIAEKQAQKEFRKAKREVKKRRQLEREMQIQAYGQYLENQGYRVKYPWTWLRLKRLIRTILIGIGTCLILWQIPFVKKPLIGLYQDNFIVKCLVDIVVSIFQSIRQAIQSIF